jgi:hypothetical protein
MSEPNYHRQDMFLFTGLAFLGGSILTVLLASLTSVASTGIGSGWTALLGTILGSVISFSAIQYHDGRRREQEREALRASIYAEIADRAARCANDFINPWKNWPDRRELNSDIRKFCPTDPVVLPGVAGKLGLLDAKTLLAVTQFYFRLSALKQAIEFVAAEQELRQSEGKLKGRDPDHQRHVALIVTRLQSCFMPALRSLENLEVPKPSEFDEEATQIYPHLRAERDKLRNVLRKYAS